MCKCLITLFTAFLLFSSCCKDIPTPAFTAEDLAWMPYKDGDTLKMKGSNGKQLWLRFSDTRESTGKVNKSPSSFEPQCPIGAKRSRTMSVMNVSYTNKTIDGKPDTLRYECFLIGSFEYTIDKRHSGNLVVNITSLDYFDSRKAKRIDTIIKGSSIVLYKDTAVNTSIYPKNPTQLYSDLYITPGKGIFRINFKNFKNADYEIY